VIDDCGEWTIAIVGTLAATFAGFAVGCGLVWLVGSLRAPSPT
jgi:hypothetical protein